MACLDDWPGSGILSLCQQKCQVHLPFNYMQCLHFNIPEFSPRKRLFWSCCLWEGEKYHWHYQTCFFPNVSNYPHLPLYKHFTWRLYLVICSILCYKQSVWIGYKAQHFILTSFSYFPLILSQTQFTLDRPALPECLNSTVVCRGFITYCWHIAHPLLSLA